MKKAKRLRDELREMCSIDPSARSLEHKQGSNADLPTLPLSMLTHSTQHLSHFSLQLGVRSVGKASESIASTSQGSSGCESQSETAALEVIDDLRVRSYLLTQIQIVLSIVYSHCCLFAIAVIRTLDRYFFKKRRRPRTT